MSSNNVNKKNNSSRGHGGMKVVDKPKDFMGSIKKLIGSLRDFKVLIFVAIVLAGLSSILSLVTPNKLSDLTDEISKGITINTDNMKLVVEDISSGMSKINEVLGIDINNETIYMVNSSSIDIEDKNLFNVILGKISEDKDNFFVYFS